MQCKRCEKEGQKYFIGSNEYCEDCFYIAMVEQGRLITIYKADNDIYEEVDGENFNNSREGNKKWRTNSFRQSDNKS